MTLRRIDPGSSLWCGRWCCCNFQQISRVCVTPVTSSCNIQPYEQGKRHCPESGTTIFISLSPKFIFRTSPPRLIVCSSAYNLFLSSIWLTKLNNLIYWFLTDLGWGKNYVLYPNHGHYIYILLLDIGHLHRIAGHPMNEFSFTFSWL